jgi:hypothetical protein
MQVYQTDNEGFYIGTNNADPDPIQAGNWLIPGGCVTAEPPALTDGQRAQWTGSAWVVVDPVPEPEPEPEPEPTLEELRAQTRIPRAKFAIAAAKAGLITEAEAEEWAAGAANPQWVSDALEAAVTAGHIPQEERLEVRIAVRTQDTIGRNDLLIPILADSKGLTPEQVDALFGI